MRVQKQKAGPSDVITPLTYLGSGPVCSQALYDPFTDPGDKLRAATRQRGIKINASADDEKWLSEGQVVLSNADISCTTSRKRETNASVLARKLIVIATLYDKQHLRQYFQFVVTALTTLLKVGSDTQCYGLYSSLLSLLKRKINKCRL